MVSVRCSDNLHVFALPDHNKFSTLSYTTAIFPNFCIWRRSLRSNLGGNDPTKTLSSHLNMTVVQFLHYTSIAYWDMGHLESSESTQMKSQNDPASPEIAHKSSANSSFPARVCDIECCAVCSRERKKKTCRVNKWRGEGRFSISSFFRPCVLIASVTLTQLVNLVNLLLLERIIPTVITRPAIFPVTSTYDYGCCNKTKLQVTKQYKCQLWKKTD